jgi:hypothetical protein
VALRKQPPLKHIHKVVEAGSTNPSKPIRRSVSILYGVWRAAFHELGTAELAMIMVVTEISWLIHLKMKNRSLQVMALVG